MNRIAWIAVFLAVLALPASLFAGERWELKVETEKPAKFVFDNPLGVREVYWYVLYTVTNTFPTSEQDPESPNKDRSIDNMCLDIWISTDANYRMLFPLVEKLDPGVEGTEYEVETEMYGRFDELLATTRWGEGSGKMLSRYEGAGACYHDGFFPYVQDAIEIKTGRKLMNCLEINATPLKAQEARHGVAIFSDSPVEETKLYAAALNHLYVQAEEKKDLENSLGQAMLQAYERLFPEGKYIASVKTLLEMKGNAERIIPEIESIRAKYVEGMKKVQSSYDTWIKETEMFTEAVMCFIYHDFKKGSELLDELYQNYPDGEHRPDIERLRILAKQKLMAEAREHAEKVRARLSESKSISPEADRMYVTFSGATDPVFGWKDKVYAQEKLLQFVFRRTGGEIDRDFDFLRLVERRWIEPPLRPIRKVVPDPAE